MFHCTHTHSGSGRIIFYVMPPSLRRHLSFSLLFTFWSDKPDRVWPRANLFFSFSSCLWLSEFITFVLFIFSNRPCLVKSVAQSSFKVTFVSNHFWSLTLITRSHPRFELHYCQYFYWRLFAVLFRKEYVRSSLHPNQQTISRSPTNAHTLFSFCQSIDLQIVFLSCCLLVPFLAYRLISKHTGWLVFRSNPFKSVPTTSLPTTQSL